ncbi:MAG: glycosyltransferase family 29 protein [Alphaproteobacteria bacterium]|nr:glycosyltransferase family 29 protein [Alphaproteobacteria bacterium]
MIKKSAFIFEKMKTYQNNFIHYLKKKTIAVVGNSPNLIGTGKGREIDKHDVVFRMNAFDLPLQFKSDLGSKTNIFVTNANFEIVNNSNTFCSYDYHFIAMDLYHINLSSFTKVSDFIENYYQLISEGEHVTFLPSEISLSLKLESKLQIATTGLKLIYLLHKNDIPFDLYGFNEKKYDNDSIVENPLKRKYECKNDFFTEEIRTSSFYKNKNIFESGHNFNEELEFRINLLSKECKK